MGLSNKKTRISKYEIFLKKYPEYAQLKMACKFTGIEPFIEEMGYRGEGEEGVTHYKDKKCNFSITVDAIAHGFFDDFELTLYFTFDEDRGTWESKQKYFNMLISDENMILVTADIYSVIDAGIKTYDPEIIVLDDKFDQVLDCGDLI